MKIYTRKGDTGQTSLLGGKRVPKHSQRIEAYGTVDELNSWIGLLATLPHARPQVALLRSIQDRLFTLGSLLAADPEGTSFKLPELQESDVTELEQSIDSLEADLPALRNFVLPGSDADNAHAHVARTVCRRAERRLVELAEVEPVDALNLKYLNRLSDWLFVFSRALTLRNGTAEVAWTPRG
jgi:cob(I)alamin adenosyltransferase